MTEIGFQAEVDGLVEAISNCVDESNVAAILVAVLCIASQAIIQQAEVNQSLALDLIDKLTEDLLVIKAEIRGTH